MVETTEEYKILIMAKDGQSARKYVPAFEEQGFRCVITFPGAKTWHRGEFEAVVKVELMPEEIEQYATGMHAVFTKYLGDVPVKVKINTMKQTGAPEELGPKLKVLIQEARGHVHDIFKQFDKDGSQEVDKTELQKVVAQLGLKMTKIDVHNMVLDLDKNRDGKI